MHLLALLLTSILAGNACIEFAAGCHECRLRFALQVSRSRCHFGKEISVRDAGFAKE